jgi:hypothetical protein
VLMLCCVSCERLVCALVEVVAPGHWLPGASKGRWACEWQSSQARRGGAWRLGHWERLHAVAVGGVGGKGGRCRLQLQRLTGGHVSGVACPGVV